MKIAILAIRGRSTNILVNFLKAEFRGDELFLIVEKPVSRVSLLKGRVRKLGYLKTGGQLLFMALIIPLIKMRSKQRTERIREAYRLNFKPVDVCINHQVDSVNDAEVVAALDGFAPDVVLVNGTRIIKPHIFSGRPYRFVNTHAGITPMYRGVHGGYWSRWNNDSSNFGSTIHYIDAGVDTGTPLAYCRTEPTDEDTFATYPLIQQAVSLDPLKGIIQSISQDVEIPTAVSDSPFSRQWYHPTIWEYFSGMLRGVR